MAKLSLLCQVNGGCMGCCGHDFKSKEKIKEAIRKNTLEFSKADPKVKAQYMKFRDRARPSDLRDGVCRNLIEKKKQLFCPLHPSLHKEDLRLGHCDTGHLCKTAREFAQWGKRKQERFLDFVESKGLDSLEYSILMDNGSLLKEFQANN